MLWPEVTCKLARQALRTAHDGCRQFLGDDVGDYLDKGAGKFADAVGLKAYRDNLRATLRRSGLAQLMPSGLDLLPAPEEVLPEWYLPVLSTFKPRTYQQLVQHVGQFLPCYLRIYDANRIAYLIQRNTILGTSAIVLFVIARMLSGVPSPIAFFVALGLFIVAVIIGYRAIFVPGASLIYRQINFAELYYYLRDAYADPVEAQLPLEVLEGETALELAATELQSLPAGEPDQDELPALVAGPPASLDQLHG